MAQRWNYLTLIVNTDTNSIVDVRANENVPGVNKTAEIYNVLDTLGNAGWELVTSFNSGNGRPLNLVFKHPA